ncbi:MAG TPA: hypothetical protein VGJ40_06725 [Gaiellaceae bacterium]
MVQHGEALTRESGDASLAEAVVSGVVEGHGPRLVALLEYARKLTLTPAEIVEQDLERLRAHGLDDRAIVDANQIVSYYNYVNRVADGARRATRARLAVGTTPSAPIRPCHHAIPGRRCRLGSVALGRADAWLSPRSVGSSDMATAWASVPE